MPGLVLLLVLASGCGGAIAHAQDLRAPSATAEQRPGDASRSWTIAFDRTAKSDGQIPLLVWRNDEAEPTQVVVPVQQGQTENSIALATRDLLRDALGVKDFETDVAKARVFVRIKHGERRFSVQVGENTAEGVKVDLYAR
jgi:hypothetical protein